MRASEVDAGEPDRLIDAKALLATTTVEELATKADELVRSMEDPSALLAKPVSSLQEAPDLLACFGMLLSGVAPLPEETVLDFGAGSCWTSWFLAQMGCRVVAMDLSDAMLDLGRRRFDEHPLFGARPQPTFSVFDGHVMDLPDDSVDRIICFDALHHVANVAEVLAEMGRVLRPGGVAGFSEPGPHHSRDPQSQHEMRRYGVPECDLVLEDVWRWAQAAGFSEISVALFSPTPQWVGFDEFQAFLAADDAPGVLGRLAGRTLPARAAGRAGRAAARVQRVAGVADRYRRVPTARASYRHLAHVRGVLHNRRMFVLRVPGSRAVDSREATGLAVELHVHDLAVRGAPDTTIVSGVCMVRNTGRNRWLPSSAGLGAVLLGLRVGTGAHPAADHGRVALPGDTAVEPGGQVAVPFSTHVPTPRPGDDAVRLELDLVAEGITWFASVRGHPVVVPIPPSAP